jgi:hypothetical protein
MVKSKEASGSMQIFWDFSSGLLLDSNVDHAPELSFPIHAVEHNTRNSLGKQPRGNQDITDCQIMLHIVKVIASFSLF